jgi:hypothetical protein
MRVVATFVFLLVALGVVVLFVAIEISVQRRADFVIQLSDPLAGPGQAEIPQGASKKDFDDYHRIFATDLQNRLAHLSTPGQANHYPRQRTHDSHGEAAAFCAREYDLSATVGIAHLMFQ